MKKRFLRLLSLALAAFLASPASAQPTSTKVSDKSIAPGKFQFSWRMIDAPELETAAKRLSLVEQRFDLGNSSKEELFESRVAFEQLQRRIPHLLTVRSGGGPLSAFLAAASESDDRSFNLINAGEPADLETQLPPFNLRNANWGTVIGVLESFLNSRGLGLKFVGGDSPNPAEAKSVVCVLNKHPGAYTGNQSPKTLFDSFPLGAYLTGQSIDDIVGAVRAGWELDPTHDRDALRLKFHPPTSILLVSGPHDAIMVASKVISQLKGPGDKDSKSNPRPSQPATPENKR